MKIKNILPAVLSGLLFLGFTACKEDEFGKHSDIDYPVPVISSVTDNVASGSEITITGSNFSEPNAVTLGSTPLTIVSQTPTGIVALLPRIFDAGQLSVKNVYGMSSSYGKDISPNYPADAQIKVTSWPAVITRGEVFVIRGENVDMIVTVTINSTTFEVDGNAQSPTRLVLRMPDDLAGSQAVVSARTVHGTTIESPQLDIEDASDVYIPVADLLIFDFEDGQTRYVQGDLGQANYTAQINRAGIAPEAVYGGSNYFSFYATNIPSMWDYLGSVKYSPSPAIDLIEFHDPHLTFLVNSDDNVGNFQFAVTQNGTTFGGYFAAGSTDNPGDAWCLRPTFGNWQWVSARLTGILTENWSGTGVQFDPYGMIDGVELIIKPINAWLWNGVDTSDGNNNEMKLNIDYMVITDGPYLQYP